MQTPWGELPEWLAWVIGGVVTPLLVYLWQRKKPRAPNLDLPDFQDAEKAAINHDNTGPDLFRLMHHTTRYGETLHGRSDDISAIEEWANAQADNGDIAVALIAAAGGAGKSRLALEAAHRMDKQGWLAGVARHDNFNPARDLPGKDWRRSFWRRPRGLLLIIDYPEELGAATFEKWLKDIRNWQRKTLWRVRILVLTRDQQQGLWERPIQNALSVDEPSLRRSVPPLNDNDALALARDVHEKLHPLSEFHDLPEGWEAAFGARLESDSQHRRPLLTIAAMLKAMLREHPSPRGLFSLNASELLRALAEREMRRAENVSGNLGWNETTLPRLLALATLTDGLRESHLRALRETSEAFHGCDADTLKRTPWWDEKRNRLASLQPDRPAAAFVVAALLDGRGHDAEALPSWLHCALENKEAAFCERLPRLIYDISTVSVKASKRLQTALTHMAEANPEIAEKYAAITENAAHSAAAFAVAVGRILVEQTESQMDKARRLNNLANRLAELGQREEALPVAREAENIYRRLAEANPEAYEPDLAMSLNNLANRLSELGQREEALSVAREAVDIYRRLAEANPEAHEPYLAGSLNNLANRLSELGQREEALPVAREAVDIYRRLAEANPEAHEPYLAGSLNNLANHLSELGQREEALSVAREAVDIRRRLAEANPEAHEPDLARSLNNLATFLSELGQREEALPVAREAVDIYRRLAEANPEAYEPDLAASLNNLATFLSEMGQREEALPVAREAVDIQRRLAEANPEAYEPDLAGSLGAMGQVYLRQEQTEQARETFAEGLRSIIAPLQAIPGAHAPLAGALLQTYLVSCEAAGKEPDETLIAPIQSVLEQLEEKQD